MDIFKKYTRKTLAANRSRTLVTIIGIVLSMALLTAVIEGAYSGIQWLIRGEIERSGKWEAYFYDLTDSEYNTLTQQQEIKEQVSWKQVGWAKIGSDNDYKPYLLINSVPDDFSNLVALHIQAGRMPENESEITLPSHLAQNGLSYKVGDIIELSVGRRVSGSEELSSFAGYNEDRQEEIVDAVSRTYTVVGIYERLDRSIENYGCPGFIALTTGPAEGAVGTFITVNNPSDIYEFTGKMLRNNEISSSTHNDLINYRGTVRNGGVQTMIYGLATILGVMIAFGSISLIYNSFSISLSERTKQYGILKSVGATKKQIRSGVLYEALILAGIGIPLGMIIGCLGIGITLYCLRDAFAGFRMSAVPMRLVISPAALIISAVISLIVILISAWIPAGRAARISPVEAIRQNNDTKIKAREVRTSKLTLKLFGFEGMMATKNFKRNGKRYRATIISLFMSVVLFISASSFCSYLTNSVDSVVSDGSDMDIIFEDYGSRRADTKETATLISSVPGISRLSYAELGGNTIIIPSEIADSRYLDLYSKWNQAQDGKADPGAVIDFSGVVAFIADDEFRDLLKSAGLGEEDYFDQTDPKALFYNHAGEYVDSKMTQFDIVKNNSVPFTAKVSTYKEIEGRSLYEIDTDGGKVYAYFTGEYVDEFWREHNSINEMDLSQAMVLSEDEALIYTDLEIAAVTQETSYVLSDKQPAVIYPYSMVNIIFPDEAARTQKIPGSMIGIGAGDYNKVYTDIRNLLSSEGISTSRLYNAAEDRDSQRTLVTVINVFAYGFIILISLIALANVFNTISTSIMLRRREFAMLKSIGLSQKGFRKMMNFECLIYGCRSLLFGIPVALLMTVWIYNVTANAIDQKFYIPWNGVVIAVASVFIVVFATMLYATSRIKRDNPIDALKNENL